MALYGDWKKAGVILKHLSEDLCPIMRGVMKDNGEIVLETIRGHIDAQDLDWVELAENTIRLKNGDDTIYVETGYLKDNISVRKIKSSSNSVTYFIGASPWKVHKPSGRKFSDIVVWMEYGTVNMPPRPLIRPSFDEVKDEIRRNIYDHVKDLLKGGS